ncbi:Conidiation protein 6-domain-containing protein [Pyronema omphalodes]|nr:Conidiation protein 6-domain-containing protein [Pyronema omphalodes]
MFSLRALRSLPKVRQFSTSTAVLTNPGNVIGGYKASLKNPNVSQEAKQHSREVLDEVFDGGDTEHFSKAPSRNGGYGRNDYDSDLSSHSGSRGGYGGRNSGSSSMTDMDDEYHLDMSGSRGRSGRGSGGSAMMSDGHFRDNDPDAYSQMSARHTGDMAEFDSHGKRHSNVLGGLKATLKNPNVSEEAKQRARERLENGDF